MHQQQYKIQIDVTCRFLSNPENPVHFPFLTASAENKVHCSALLTEEDQAEMMQYHSFHPGSNRTTPLISISAKPLWERGRTKQHLALPGVRKQDVIAITNLEGTASESSSS